MDNLQISEEEAEIQKDIRDLVVERIRVMSSNLQVSIGNDGKILTKDSMLKSVKDNTDLGKKIVKIQIDFLKDMASGRIYEQ